ncbi:unnamed protein product [Moneuplotes crassus]|uniref:Uncharacterized protein n=1 Tax=Euplotes crassus TaxID=5936 RepID=A0AAD1XLF7_EUPCR|nr:unnamed protein product [Moneuplotes crassus]
MAETESLTQKELMLNAGIALGILIPLFFCCSFWTVVFYIGAIRMIGNISFLYRTVKEYYLTKQLDLSQRYGEGTYALITGGANGIGLEYATQLAKMNFNLVIIDLNQEALDKAKEDITNNSSVEVITIQADITKYRAISEYDDLLKSLEGLDTSILVNNVGVGSCLPFNEASPALVNTILDLNVASVVTFTSLFYERLLSRVDKEKHSAIITMASSSSFYPVPSFFLYSATKGFASYFMKSLTSEKSPKLDTLNVCPGFVSTYMTGFRKDNVTIGPELCVKNALRSLGNFSDTEITSKVRIMIAGVLQGFWYIDTCLFKKVLMYLGATEANKKAFEVVSKRERELYKD